MSVKLGDALVYLGADQKGLDQGLAQAEKTSQGWASRVADGIGIAIGGAVVNALGKLAGGIVEAGGAVIGFSNDLTVATTHLQSELGLTETETRLLGDVATDVFKDNFGENIGDAADAVGEIKQQLGLLGVTSREELTSATEYALALRDAFQVEIGESTSAASTLMENFGLTSDEAFQFIQVGLQKGMNSSGDFLDSIGEYSVQFSDAGADAGQFFALMQTGLQGGMLGTDKAADLFKEFRLRIQDGSTTTADALSQIGLSVEEINAGLNDGSLEVVDAFQLVKNALRDTDDQTAMFQAGVALMGSQFEDLGETAVQSLEFIDTGLEDVLGQAGDLNAQYNTLGTVWEGIKRKALVGLAPIGDKLLEIANRIMPFIDQAFQTFEETLGPVIDKVAGVVGIFSDLFFDSLAEGVPFVESLQYALSGVIPPEIMEKIEGVIGFLTDLFAKVQEFVEEHAEGLKAAIIAIGVALAAAAIVSTILSVAGAIAALANPITLVLAAIAALAVAWTEDWGGIRTKLTEAWEKIQPKLQLLWDWLKIKVPEAIEVLRGFWEETLLPAIERVWSWIQETLFPLLEDLWEWLGDTIPVVLEELSDLWENLLKPALELVWSFIQDNLFPLLSELWELIKLSLMVAISALADLWETTLKPALETVWKFVKDHFNPILETMKSVFDGIAGAVQSVIGWIGSLIDKLSGVELPEWMQRHSPSPIEQTLWGAAEAMRQLSQVELPQLQASLRLSAGAGALGGGAGGGGSVHYNNLTIHTAARSEDLAADYRLLQSMGGRL